MTRKDFASFMRCQRLSREQMLRQYAKNHGYRTVSLAMRHIDYLHRRHPVGLAGLAPLCRELRGRRGESRSWSLAADIYIELLKDLAAHLERLEGIRATKRVRQGKLYVQQLVG